MNIKVFYMTENLIIRSFKEEDILSFMEYRNNLEWMKHQDYKGLSFSEYKEGLLREETIEKGFQLAIIKKDDDILIGDLYIKKDIDEIFIGYTINPPFSRQGFMKEAVEGLIKFIKSKYRNIPILAETIEENIASINFLKKLNFDFLKKYDDVLVFKLKE